MTADCDGDTILMRVRPAGPTCHTGAETCFGAAGSTGAAPSWPTSSPSGRGRRSPTAPTSPGCSPASASGPQRKVGEEAVEVLLAEPGSEHLVTEVADLWFHSCSLLARDGLDPLAPLDELRRRRGAPRRERTAD